MPTIWATAGTLEEHAESEKVYFDEAAQQDSWDHYEVTTFQKRQHGAYEYYVMAYRWRDSEEYCISDNVDLIFLSDFYPSKPYALRSGERFASMPANSTLMSVAKC